jgi:ABC-2 type transport system permease protein
MMDFLRVWASYLNLNFKMWKEYRTDFVIGITAMTLSTLAAVLYSWVIFQNIVSLNGWTFGQMLFLQGLLAIIGGLWGAFFSGLSPWRLDEEIRQGTLDQVLLKPVGTMKYLIISYIDKDDFGRIITALVMLVVGASLSGIVWGIDNTLMLLVFIASGLVIDFSIMTIFSSLSFWTTKARSLAGIIWHLMNFANYPLEIYNPVIIFLLTFIIPLGFISYYPAETFLGKGLYVQVAYLSPVVALIFLTIAYSIWRYSLRHYASTGT